jgi:hypothetical protein
MSEERLWVPPHRPDICAGIVPGKDYDETMCRWCWNRMRCAVKLNFSSLSSTNFAKLEAKATKIGSQSYQNWKPKLPKSGLTIHGPELCNRKPQGPDA